MKGQAECGCVLVGEQQGVHRDGRALRRGYGIQASDGLSQRRMQHVAALKQGVQFHFRILSLSVGRVLAPLRR